MRLCAILGRSARIYVLALSALFLGAVSSRADLVKYVKKPDASFQWKLAKQYTEPLSQCRIYQIELTSQTWHDIVWKHDLLVVLPPKVKPTSTMFLWNQGGSVSVKTTATAIGFARTMEAPVAFLFGIPNQPQFGNLKEDALIAETFVRYLNTKDGSWPLLFPMVKSLAKAMDALQAFARQEWKTEVKQFVVSGASKRGWTTWLTAVADPRVKAIVPMVIDTLNMKKQMEYQKASYGDYSVMITDYTKRNLVPAPKTPEGENLWKMVDPWVYRDQITVPKLIMNGTNDPYWTQDALNLYYDDIKGNKAICYVPNAGHNLAEVVGEKKTDLTRATQTLAAFVRSHIHGKPWPKITWKHGEKAGKYTLSVDSDIEPKAARLWQADAPTRDFRKSTWKQTPAKLNSSDIKVEVEAPKAGCRVFFVEYEYEIAGVKAFLSTQVRIVGTAEKK